MLPARSVGAMMPLMKIGDTVVTMSHPGPFKVVEIEGTTLTILNPHGLRKQVHTSHVRLLEKDEPATT